MAVLKFIFFVAIVIVILAGIFHFNEHCQKKFSYRFFTSASYITSAVATWAAMAGYNWYEYSNQNGGDILNGIVIMIIAGIIAGALIYYNFKKTNLIYGVGGTALQLGLFIPLAYASTVLVILMLLAVIFGKFGATPVRIIK